MLKARDKKREILGQSHAHAHACCDWGMHSAWHSRVRASPHHATCQGALLLELGRVGAMPVLPRAATLMCLVGVPSLEMHTAYGNVDTCMWGRGKERPNPRRIASNMYLVFGRCDDTHPCWGCACSTTVAGQIIGNKRRTSSRLGC